MPLLNTSAAEAVARALDSAPNARIDPKIWAELGRLHRGLGEMASLVDAVNNPGTSDYSGVPVNTHLQEMTVVTARAGELITKYGPCRLEFSGGELKAFNTVYPTDVFTRADAIAPATVAAGAIGEFILKGIAFAYVINLTSANMAAYHSRIFARGNYENLLGGNYFTAEPGTVANGRDFATCGVFLHAYAVNTESLSTILMYFNPERTWLDRVAS